MRSATPLMNLVISEGFIGGLYRIADTLLHFENHLLYSSFPGGSESSFSPGRYEEHEKKP